MNFLGNCTLIPITKFQGKIYIKSNEADDIYNQTKSLTNQVGI